MGTIAEIQITKENKLCTDHAKMKEKEEKGFTGH